jgi:GTP1/Obg family GTP-binding protein
MNLIRTPQIADADGFYEELIDSLRGLSDEQAALANAKLVLILANHIGDRDALRQALALAQPARSMV